jgi:hypothetical protein
MKKTAEKPVAESVKLCIELDEEMQEQWQRIKSHLESAFRYAYKISVTLPDYIVFEGLLDGFENELCSMSFPHRFTIKEVKGMKKQKQNQ